jgi:hypothetical protein
MKKLYIYNQPFKFYQLKDNSIINISNLDLVDNDELMIVSDIYYENYIFNIEPFKIIKSKKFFYNKETIGNIIEDSFFYVDNKKFFLFKLNPIEYKLTSRQRHGFIYEMEVKDLNNLQILKNIHKWDAYGSLDKEFILNRMENDKIIILYDSNETIVVDNDNIDEIWYNSYKMRKFKENIHWSIKCMANKTDIELGDFKRISGLTTDDDNNIKQVDSDIERFFLVVSFHDNTSEKKIIEEYIIFMGTYEWKSYLPKTLFELHNGNYVYNEMYDELKQHRLIGNRTEETEYKWNLFTQKYRELTKNSLIKLRFKRDTKGQLRIQSAISYNNFINILLKNPHIKIY